MSLKKGEAQPLTTVDAPGIIDFPADGPVYRDNKVRPAVAPSSLFIPAMTGWQRFQVGIMSALWVAGAVIFMLWWANPSHIIGPVRFAFNTLLLSYLILMPAIFVWRIHKIRKVSPDVSVPVLRTAFVVTRAPSEEWHVVETTLRAMLNQKIPIAYDVWLCDERPTSAIRRWCANNGVLLCSRDGVTEYHQEVWPRRTRCKEGNLAYFYDTVGYQKYDVVAQLDCDHVPSPTYLAHMLQPFSCDEVGFVAAPSICDSNAEESWAARGRLHMESVFHGPFQASHNGGMLPISIGSHYAVRTSALKRAGGIGPELAEDFSTSYLIYQAGYDGAFAIDAEAHGLGPTTCAAMLTQEFQWTRSLTVLALGLVRRTVRRVPAKTQARLTFGVTFNAVFGAMALIGTLLAPASVVFDFPWASINFLEFLVFLNLLSLPLVAMVGLLRGAGLLRPVDSKIISWELVLYQIVRWPFLVHGTIAGARQVLTGKKTEFRVTPKAMTGVEPFAFNQLIPLLLVIYVQLIPGIWGLVADRSIGYAGLCLLGAVLYAVAAFSMPILHAAELEGVEPDVGPRAQAVAGPAIVAGFTLALCVAAIVWYSIVVF
ncbi:glycosyltransferase family 2 protein [Corynebacterium sp. H78]|uniref:glycosyltransferase family 2 protein n=1 Tax=Corynebacterium sp. H78 TaxID=3133417 RepID=UPI0030A3BA79